MSIRNGVAEPEWGTVYIHLPSDAKQEDDAINSEFMIHLQKWIEIEALLENQFHRLPVRARLRC
jgi:hypothetical protein